MADVMRADGNAPSIYSAHTMKPLDAKRINGILSMYEQIITLEEHVFAGGLGMRVQARAQGGGFTACRNTPIALHDKFLHTYGSKDDLLAEHGIDLNALLAVVSGEVG